MSKLPCLRVSPEAVALAPPEVPGPWFANMSFGHSSKSAIRQTDALSFIVAISARVARSGGGGIAPAHGCHVRNRFQERLDERENRRGVGVVGSRECGDRFFLDDFGNR